MRPSSREHAAALVEALTRYVAQRDDAGNRANLKVAQEWLRLYDTPRPEPAEVKALKAAAEKLENVGCITIDLKLALSAWAPRNRRPI